MVVDGALEMTEETRSVLHLVDDERRRVPTEEPSGISLRLLSLAGEIERHETVPWKQALD
jgi:hypothetical protein